MKTAQLMFMLSFIFFPVNAQSSHFLMPVATPVSCDYYIHLSVKGLPADLNDEIAFFDPQGNICGLYQIENSAQTIIVHVYGDHSETIQDEGAMPNDILTIHIWDHSESKEYDNDSLMISSITPDSQFFVPGSIPPVWQAEKGFAISVDTRPWYQPQQTSPFVCTFVGQITLLTGLAPPGTEIGVFDPDGVLCGAFRIKTAGQYGMLHVYGDDPDTIIDEGAVEGDILSFRIMDFQNLLEIQSNAIITTPGENIGSFMSSDNPPAWHNLAGYHLHLTQNDHSTVYPIAQTKTVNGVEDQSMYIVLTAIDPDHEPLWYEISVEPKYGQLIMIDEEEGDCYYSPDPNFFGTDTFWFTAKNTIGVTDTAQITIQLAAVNDPPIASSQSTTIEEDNSAFLFLSGEDQESAILSFEIVQPAKHGVLLLMNAGLCRYTPNPNYSGQDVFFFIARDESFDSEPVPVTITITPVNDVPQLLSSNIINLKEDESISLTIHVDDPDNDPISYELSALPKHGQLTGILPSINYTPDTNYAGSDSFLLIISDHTESFQTNFEITIEPVNDPPTAIAIAPLTVYESMPVKLDASQSSDIETKALSYLWSLPDLSNIALDNPSAISPILTPPELAFPQSIYLTLTVSDCDLTDTTTFALWVVPQHLITVQADEHGLITPYGNIQVYHDEAIVFEIFPDPNYLVNQFFLDDIPQTLSENHFELHSIQTDHNIFVTFKRVNRPPIAEDQKIQTPLNTPVQFQLGASDPDNDPLDILLDTSLLQGQITIDGFTATYTPSTDFNHKDSFSYKASDNLLESNTATVDIFVGLPIVDAIVVEDTTQRIILPTKANIINDPKKGTINDFVTDIYYVPNPNENGLDQFQYELEQQIYDFKIYIKPVNDPPTAIAIAPLTAYEGMPVQLDASQSSDLETKQLSCIWTLPNLPNIALDNPFAISPTLTPPELAVPQNIYLTMTVSDGEMSDTTTVSIWVIPRHTIKVQAGEHGQISPSGNFNVYHDNSMSFDILPDPNYLVDQFILDGMPQPLSENHFELNHIQKDHGIFVTFVHANQAPVAHNQKIQTPVDTSIQFELNASDPDNDALDLFLDTGLLEGYLKCDGLIATYTPLPGFIDKDSFTYKVFDGKKESNSATVDIFVGLPIVDAIVLEDTTQRLIMPTKANIVTDPQQGELNEFVTDIYYVPDPNANGLDQFQYELNQELFTFQIFIKAINDAPIAKTASYYTVTERQTLVLDASQSLDIDNDDLRYTWTLSKAAISISDPLVVTPQITAPDVDNAGMQISVTLTVSDPGGLTSQAFSTIIVQDMPDPVASFQIENGNGIVPLNVQFIDTSIYPESWFWDFGDGSTSINNHPMHVYKSAGTYSVTLTVQNSGGMDHHTKTNCIIVGLEPLSVDFSTSGNQGVIPYTVTFYPQIRGEVENWQWDFGDGTISYDFQPTHIYKASGQYTVTLSASRITETVQKSYASLIQTSGHKIVGQVKASDSGNGIANYRVDISLMDAFIASSLTDEHGFYTIDNLEPSSRYILSAWPSDTNYVYQYYNQKRFAFEATYVATDIPGQQIIFLMEPAPQAWVSGTVTNGITPLANIQVDIFSENLGVFRSQTTQNNGTYTFTGLEIASDYQVSVYALEKQFFFAMHDGGIVGVDQPIHSVFIESQATSITPSTTGLRNIDIIVNPIQGAFIAGYVTDEKGNPMSRIHVNAWSDPLNVGGSAFSDATGHYTITGLKTVLPENVSQTGYFVIVQPSNYMFQAYHRVIDSNLATRVGTDRTDINFQLTTQGRITGSVTEMSGVKVSDADIQVWSLSDISGKLYHSKSDNLGRFQLNLPVASDYIVSMKTNNYAIQYYNQQTDPDLAETISLQQGNVSDIRFIVDKGPIIKGYVYEEVFGTPSTNATVVIESRNLGTIQTMQADDSGFFQFTGLDIDVSDYIISVLTEGYLPAYYADNMDGKPENDTVFDFSLAEGLGATAESSATNRFLTIKQGLNVTGQINNNDGLSISNATIQLISDQGVWKTTSNHSQDINFSMTGILPDTYQLVVTAQNYITYQDQLTITDDLILDISLTPEPRRSIHGTVNQLEEGTQIEMIVWSETRNIYQTKVLAGTGEIIAYTVDNLPPASDYIVSVLALDYASQYYPDKNRQDDAEPVDLSLHDAYLVDFVLTKNLSNISGRLTFDKNPASGKTVRLEAKSESTGGFGFTKLILSASQEINYTISGLLPSDDYIVYLQSAFYQNRYWDASDTGTLSYDLATPVATPGRADFIIHDGLRISGTITDSNGDPMRVQVEIWSQNTQTQKVTQTNASGVYVVDGLIEADDYRIKVTTNKNGFYYYHASGAVRQESRSQLLSTDTGNLEGIDMVLVTGAYIHGIVQTYTGQRIEGIWVNAWSDSQNVGGGAFSDTNGEYIIYDLPLWHDYAVTAEPTWNMPYETSHQTLVSVPSENTNFILRHKKGVSISGIIRDPSGKPVHKAIVKMQYVNQNKRPAWTITDSKGRYMIDLLTPSQTFKLEITPPKNQDWAVENRSVYMNTDQSMDIMLSSGYIFSGEVFSINEQKPLANALMTIWSQSRQFAGETTSRANGKFEINHVPMATDYVLTVKATGFLDKKEIDQTPERNMNISMEPAGQISGIVRSLLTGAPIENASVEIYSQANQALADYKGIVSTNDQGKFFITGLKLNDRQGKRITDFVITAYASGFPPLSQIGKKSGDSVVFNLTKSRKNELTGTVGNLDGRMLVIDIFSDAQQFVKTVMAKADFTIDGLKSKQGYMLKFIALTFSGIIHEEWAGENDMGTLEKNQAKIYTAPDQISFEFSFLNNPQKRIKNQFSGPGPVQNLQSLSHEYFSQNVRKRNIQTGSNIPSNNPNVVVTWEPPLEDRENIVGYYSQFNTQESQEIDKFNITQKPPIRTRKITSRDLMGDDVQYYFHVAAVDKEGRIGETQSIAFRIDTIPPANVQVIAPDISNTRNISLILGATGASEMYISNINYYEGGQWENISNKKTWQLTDGQGTKNIYARFRDRAGNATQTAEITMFQPPLPTYIIKASSDFHGTITPSGGISVSQGDSLTFTVIPESQYTIAEFSVDSKIVELTSNTYIMTNIQKPHQIHVSFKQANLRPYAVSKTIYGLEDSILEIELTGSDPNNDSLVFDILQTPGVGTINKISDDQYTYQPAPNSFGLFYLKFTASDEILVSEPGIITLVVEAVNDPPRAIGQSVETEINTPVEIILKATDVDNDPLTFSVEKKSPHGSVAVYGQKAIFTPDSGFNNPTEFTFKAYDGKLFSNAARVEIWVGLPPVDTVLTEDTPLALSIPSDALLLTSPVKGTFSIANGGYYTPFKNMSGNDVFYYQVNGVVKAHSLFIKPVNDPPEIMNDIITLKEDHSIEILLTATDIENDPVTFSILKPPKLGSIEENLPAITYTPLENKNGTDQLVVEACDGMDCVTKTLTIEILNVNDVPVAKDQNISKMPLVIPVSFTLEATDIDIADMLSYTIVSRPQTGILSGGDANWTYTQEHWGIYEFQFIASDGKSQSNTGTVTLYLDMPVVHYVTPEDIDLDIYDHINSIAGNNTVNLSTFPAHGRMLGNAEKGIWGYRPNQDYFGTDEFSFIVGQETRQHYLKIYVYPVNDPPQIDIPEQITTHEDWAISLEYHISDVDTSSENLHVTHIAPENGYLTQTASKFLYQPAKDFNGSDVFRVEVSDNDSTNLIDVHINVLPVNDPPKVFSQQIRMREDTSQLIELKGSDIDNDPLTFIRLTDTLHGQLTGTLPYLTYTPNPDSLESDTFQFTVSDGELTAQPATVTIDIQNVNDPPHANGMQFTLDHPGSLTGTLDAFDIDTDILIYSLVDYPRYGDVIITNAVTGKFIYDAPETSGEDYFTFKVNDGYLDSNTATVFININTSPEQRHTLILSLLPPYTSGDQYRYVLLDKDSGNAIRDNVANTATLETQLPENGSYRLFIMSSKYQYYEYPKIIMPAEIPVQITLTPLSQDRQTFIAPDISQTNIQEGFYLNISSADIIYNDISILDPVNPEADGFAEITPTSDQYIRKIYQWHAGSSQYSSIETSDSGCTVYTIDIKIHGETNDYTFSVNYVSCEDPGKNKTLMHQNFETTYGPTQTHTTTSKIFYPMEGTHIRINIKDHNESLPVIIPPIPLEYLFIDSGDNLAYNDTTDMYNIFSPKMRLDTETPLMAKINYYTFGQDAPGSAVDVSLFVASGQYTGCPVRYNPIVNSSMKRYNNTIGQQAPSIVVPLLLNNESSDYSTSYQNLVDHQNVNLYIDEKGDGVDGFGEQTIPATLMDDLSDVVLLSVDHLTGIGFAKEARVVSEDVCECESDSGGCFIWVLGR